MSSQSVLQNGSTIQAYAGRFPTHWEKAGWLWMSLAWMLIVSTGCSLIPDVRHKPQFNNPFPQLRTVAVLPFVNQSEEPTLSAERVTLAYINELQSIPGFEVLPMGVVKARLADYQKPLANGEDFQELARELGVDAVLLGSVIDYTPYYPPRMSIKVNWYAANPGFHPVLPGYGMPWGTKDEKKIPRWVHREAQRALATEQLKTQTPQVTTASQPDQTTPPAQLESDQRFQQNPQQDVVPTPLMPEDQSEGELIKPASSAEEISIDPTDAAVGTAAIEISDADAGNYLPDAAASNLPSNWPDPRGFIPDQPRQAAPPMIAQHEPVISHMQNYNGHDEDFTRRVADYFYFRDDARYGGWQAYLQRSEDFIRVCCYLHVTDTLACRGGQEEGRLTIRWPIERYQR